MGVAARLAAFAAVLVICFAGAFALGSAVGPVDSVSTTEYHQAPAPHGDGDTHADSPEHGG